MGEKGENGLAPEDDLLGVKNSSSARGSFLAMGEKKPKEVWG